MPGIFGLVTKVPRERAEWRTYLKIVVLMEMSSYNPSRASPKRRSVHSPGVPRSATVLKASRALRWRVDLTSIREFAWGQAAKRTVRTPVIVVNLPSRKFGNVQTLITQPSVERFDETILGGLARADEVEAAQFTEIFWE